MRHEIEYGKAEVRVYRTHGQPLEGVRPIRESAFSGRHNRLMAAEIEVIVHGDAFWAAYTEGDNRMVVATDTMKNFIQSVSLATTACTLEAWLHDVGRSFLATYPQMESITVLGRELPFPAAVVPGDEPGSFALSEVLFSRDRCDYSTARMHLERTDGDAVRITEHASGRDGLQLIKTTGSSFASFARDEYTTLPERRDRPLYIWCDIGWTYTDPTDALAPDGDAARYVAGEQVADLAASVFHEFVSLSIQHLVHEIGQRMLATWPQLGSVSFEGQNRLWDVGAESAEDGRVRVYADPRPPFGRIGLVLRRD